MTTCAKCWGEIEYKDCFVMVCCLDGIKFYHLETCAKVHTEFGEKT